MELKISPFLTLLGSISLSFVPVGVHAEPLPLEQLPGEGLWVDPRLERATADRFRVTAWFGSQFLGDGEAYPRRSAEFEDLGRRELRERVLETLRHASRESLAAAKSDIDHLIKSETVSRFEPHWIVNGFTCETDSEGVEALKKVPGVRMLYFAGPVRRRNVIPNFPPPPKIELPEKRPAFSPGAFSSPWYVSALKADQVWEKHNVTGKGVLNIIHDGNFVLSAGILPNRYVNLNEEANGIDDDGNGFVDDLHGYDFDFGRSSLTRALFRDQGRRSAALLHGHQCVAIICGTGPPQQFGLAPESRWAGVLSGQRIEAAVEWAIEQGADTYSMSFSRPNLGEYRSHWRKMLEHGAFCGVHFVSGAGNFAQEGSRAYAPVPVQMRTPEDIPRAVFAAAGVQRDLSRTPFSSQGPVEWNTAHYQDGRVNKPEVCAFNFRLPLLLPDGTVRPGVANGNSFAGPMMCGVIALMLSANPELKPWETREILISTARDIGPEGYDFQTGHGLIDASAAVSEAIGKK